MTEIHLYGKLRVYAGGENSAIDNVIRIKPGLDDTIGSLLSRAGIPAGEIFHIFFNFKLLATRNTMAGCLGYQQAREDPHNWDLNIAVSDGDRLGIFGRDMSALVV